MHPVKNGGVPWGVDFCHEGNRYCISEIATLVAVAEVSISAK